MCVCQVFDKMQALLAARSEETDNVEWSFEGAEVCRRAWQRLHGFGHLLATHDAREFTCLRQRAVLPDLGSRKGWRRWPASRPPLLRAAAGEVGCNIKHCAGHILSEFDLRVGCRILARCEG